MSTYHLNVTVDLTQHQNGPNRSFKAQMALYFCTTRKKGRGVDDTSQMARVIGGTLLSLIFGVPRQAS
jgi:hypothetical protein